MFSYYEGVYLSQQPISLAHLDYGSLNGMAEIDISAVDVPPAYEADELEPLESDPWDILEEADDGPKWNGCQIIYSVL